MRFFLPAFLICLAFCLQAQETILLPDNVLPNTRGCERDPLKLVNKLTEGKTDEKEKFDMIFTWVAKNIHYDYFLYLSPRGASAPRVDRILKYKSGICLDYAYLMDTLCRLAGIQNVSVYGYAKDDLFDVNDSIYMDNHAWNAVRLNSFWYVYDVTWSSGIYKWQYTPFSQRIYELRRKLSLKIKIKTAKFKTADYIGCDIVKGGEYERKYAVIPFRYRIALRLLSIFKLKTRPIFIKTGTNFYLSNPETFAITHFPDNPYWSLTGNYRTMRAFETDSAYYHLSDSVYLTQKREKRFCKDCDNYFSLEEMAKEKQMKSNSYDFNKRNMFVPSMADFNISGLYYNKALPETDSLTKVSFLDSALRYIDKAKVELNACMVNVNKENSLQKSKNSRKLQVLNAENKGHITFIHSAIAGTNAAMKKAEVFIKKSRAAVLRLEKVGEKLEKITGSPIRKKKFKRVESAFGIQLELKRNNKWIDSVNNVIDSLKAVYSITSTKLSDNLWEKISQQQPLAIPFIEGSYYRSAYRSDNYKKNIVEVRKNIKQDEDNYMRGMKDSIYALSDSCFGIGLKIIDNLNKRNSFMIESTKLLTVLVRERLVPKDSLPQFIRISKLRIKEDICWLVGGSSKRKSTTAGYKLLVFRQQQIKLLIKNENRVESKRYITINKEILRRKIKFKNILSNNSRVYLRYKRRIQENKKSYLKSLKMERKEAQKKGKVKRFSFLKKHLWQ